MKQAVDQTSDPVSGLSSSQSAKRRALGPWSFNSGWARPTTVSKNAEHVISATEAEKQVYTSRDKFNPAHAKIRAPQCVNVPRYFISPLSCLFFGAKRRPGAIESCLAWQTGKPI